MRKHRLILFARSYVRGKETCKIPHVCSSLESEQGESVLKYYTAFTLKFENDPEVLHVTHKYLGEQPDHTIQEIISHINLFLAINGIVRMPAAIFDVIDYFGPSNDTRVLRSASPQFGQRLHPGLRALLDRFKTDDFPYTPHATTKDLPLIMSQFDRYVLVGGGKVIRSWGL